MEVSPGERITTARLAKEVGVSEAALYRHFPSKSKMFEGLIQFIEETLFTRVSMILKEEDQATARCEKILTLLLTFTERNPGITRILTGDALAGETGRLRARVVQLFDRYETQLKQTLREAELQEGIRPTMPVAIAANLLLATVRVVFASLFAVSLSVSPRKIGRINGRLLWMDSLNRPPAVSLHLCAQTGCYKNI